MVARGRWKGEGWHVVGGHGRDGTSEGEECKIRHLVSSTVIGKCCA